MQAPTETTGLFPFDNSYAKLPERFFAALAPAPVQAPRLIRLNVELARELGLDPQRLASQDGVEVLAGNRVADGSEPLAQAYAGHQFAHFVPQLGDGRAILLGEVVGKDGRRRDIQLKGSGPTPFSRRGDGRAALGPVLREYIVSEAMAALGIPTTRTLAAVTTGETVWRDAALPGAVLTRVAASHIRVGTFQFFAARKDIEGLRLLADHVIARHYPHVAEASNRYRALLDAVIRAQAGLVARWMLVGFIHGVMNTDNSSIAGETIDYGPCAFMDTFHPGQVYSSIDHRGRYAYANQPRIAQWNMARFAETLIPLLDADADKAVAMAQTAIDAFPGHYEAAHDDGLRAKLGLRMAMPDDDELAQELLVRMAEQKADFTLTFRRLCEAAADPVADARVAELFDDPAAFIAWCGRWRARLAMEDGDAGARQERQERMSKVNPAFIPRNHRVEEAIAAAVNEADFAPFEKLLAVLARPYQDQPENALYALPPEPDQIVQQTFCGT